MNSGRVGKTNLPCITKLNVEVGVRLEKTNILIDIDFSVFSLQQKGLPKAVPVYIKDLRPDRN
jgi:hypothetical protein